ncbi:MAG: bifunctional pantoate--beta-alanine ligase/(d)CMP kinase [Oscillatoria sp. SIO1A7]|nr:bifunctional pantoate--beta-alanine ligase/(d)CMP kinase [Oscillatoria sp. SIO1A7]
MRLLKTVAALRCYLDLQESSLQVGLVPTMGALHRGHLSLIERARSENDIVIVSIFVNPLQFAPQEDLDSYPRTWERDKELCSEAGVDAIFAPNGEDMGIGSIHTARSEEGAIAFISNQTLVIPPVSMTAVMCGKTRLHFFQGIATIVTKLLNLVRPTRAYFGQKDAQQLAIIKRLVLDLNLNVEIVPCPIVREESGLALSSRNQYLTEAEKELAAQLYKGLARAELAFRGGDRSCKSIVEVVKSHLAANKAIDLEYVELVEPETLNPIDKVEEAGLLALAAKVGSARLIDNIVLRQRKPIIAIDGPAGAGKSTVARQLAEKLGLFYLDTGAMYRAVTWLVLEKGIAVDDFSAVAEIASRAEIKFVTSDASGDVSAGRVFINDIDVTKPIRGTAVTKNVSAIAAQKEVRRSLLKQQQGYGRGGGIVAEGRDIGTRVFPDAELKIFLTASVGERAKRRKQDFLLRGDSGQEPSDEISLEKIEENIRQRDWQDSNRKIDPLIKAADAIAIDTDGLTAQEVTERIVQLFHSRR